MQQEQRKKTSSEMDFFTEYGEGNRYKIEEVIGKGSYGVVCSALDTHTGDKVAIKKINDIFEHVSDATRILREIKLLRLLRHPDIVEIKHILLPPSRREFKDIYVVFELMESDLHQVIKANDDLTPEHYQFFLYQLLRGLKYIHTANVFHRDLKPKNILANADCKLKICDFGLARVAISDTPTAIFWTDYIATRWYRAPELCGSFFSKYTPAIDIWSIGCIFAELLTGKPLFPGKNVVHQLDIITDLLGTPSPETVSRIRNEKARRYLSSMRRKKPIPFTQKFPNADPLALRLLERMLAFDPKDRPSAEEALANPYFKNIANVDREPSAQPITKLEFEFERRRITKDDIRELIYREILEYHPKMLREFLEGTESTGFMYPSAVDHFKKQFAYLEEHYAKGSTAAPPERQHNSLPRPCVIYSDNRPQSTANITEDLSRCLIRDNAQKAQQDSASIRNEKARRYLSSMRRKKPIPFTQKFPNADPLALRLLERMLAFDPKDRPSAEEALANPYFKNIANVDREPSAQPITKLEFEFERRRITKDDIRELIYREILEYHPKMLREFLEGTESTGFMYPSAVDHFKKQFAYLEEHYAKGSTAAPPERQHNSLPRPCVIYSDNRPQSTANITEDLSRCLIRDNAQKAQQDSASVGANRVPPGAAARPGKAVGQVLRGTCSTSAAEQYEQRRIARNPAIAPNNVSSGSSFPRRSQTCKSETGDAERIDASQAGPPKPYVANKLPATVDGRSGHW